MGKSKSVSFHELFAIRHIRNVLLSMIFITINYLTAKGFSQKIKSTELSDNCFSSQLINIDFLGGILMIFMGCLSSTRTFKGRRITLITISVLFLCLWNILWFANSQIDPVQFENGNLLDSDLSPFDLIMFKGDSAITFMIYQMILIAGTIDICKSYML